MASVSITPTAAKIHRAASTFPYWDVGRGGPAPCRQGMFARFRVTSSAFRFYRTTNLSPLLCRLCIAKDNLSFP